ncbi:Thymidylate synthase ThyX [bacterium HR37]|nr:Thymidylate synthase ThyX [bacterium HR37]
MAEEKPRIQDDIRKYVSNTDRDIYTVSNLPEEVIAVIFAYVSRSPKSFRDNISSVIKEEQLGQERASKFHEKWVLSYGHASVAEHATVHIGVERVSRLFSSILELSNEYLSFTEYSQRYQKPQRGDFYVPDELKDRPVLLKEFIELNNHLYDIYSNINNRLYEFLRDSVCVPDGVEEKAHLRALEKQAFEDARYVLSLATYTNLGMSANARAIEDALKKLLSSKYPEVRKRAEEIKAEVRFSVPTLVKYASENRYIKDTRDEFERMATSISIPHCAKKLVGSRVKLIDWTGKNMPDAEEYAIDKILNAVLFEHSVFDLDDLGKEVTRRDKETKLSLFKKTVEKLGKHDNPINAFKLICYEAEFVISEACWHQLLRHRKVNWIFKEPTVSYGITVPPNIERAGLVDLLYEATSESERLYKKLVDDELPCVASYVVTNAHNRCVIGSFDLWELYHLVNLRMSEGAQWDIRNVIRALTREISKYHPNLIMPALKRVNDQL